LQLTVQNQIVIRRRVGLVENEGHEIASCGTPILPPGTLDRRYPLRLSTIGHAERLLLMWPVG
jgi:hypothetical protein